MVDPARAYSRCVVRGIATFGAEAGWDWEVMPMEKAATLTGAHASTLDGIIGDFCDDKVVAALLKAGTPAVDISARAGPTSIERVATDDAAVGRVSAAYLLSLGLGQYAYFGERANGTSDARELGFRSTIVAAGIPCDTFLWPGDSDHYGELEGWIAGLPKPAGVLAGDDGRAIQLLAVCRKLGIAVPEAVAVVGVGNDEFFCDFANPPLSSVALSTRRIGHEAARALERLMRGETLREPVMLIPPAGIVPRQSSAGRAIIDPEVAAGVRYIALHVKDNLQVADVMREVLLSRRSLDQRFIKALGRTPAREINRAQVELAKQVLAETDEPMTHVAAMAGFSNAKQMGASFSDATGMTPTAYRETIRKRGPP